METTTVTVTATIYHCEKCGYETDTERRAKRHTNLHLPTESRTAGGTTFLKFASESDFKRYPKSRFSYWQQPGWYRCDAPLPGSRDPALNFVGSSWFTSTCNQLRAEAKAALQKASDLEALGAALAGA